MVKFPTRPSRPCIGRCAHAPESAGPALAAVTVRHRAGSAYITGHTSDGEDLPLCRLRQPLGLRDIPRQPRRLRRQLLPHRQHGRHPERSLGHRLRPSTRRPHRLGDTLDELTGGPRAGLAANKSSIAATLMVLGMPARPDPGAHLMDHLGRFGGNAGPSPAQIHHGRGLPAERVPRPARSTSGSIGIVASAHPFLPRARRPSRSVPWRSCGAAPAPALHSRTSSR